MENKLSDLFDYWIESLKFYDMYLKFLIPGGKNYPKIEKMTYVQILQHGYSHKTLIEPPFNNEMGHGHTRYGSMKEFNEKTISDRKEILVDLFQDVLQSWYIIPSQANHFFELNYWNASRKFLRGLDLNNIETNDFKGKIIGFKPYINWLQEQNQKKYVNELPFISNFLITYSSMVGEPLDASSEKPGNYGENKAENTSLEQPEYITRKQAAEILGITLVTLDKWADKGILKAYRIASRIRFIKSEIPDSLIRLDTLRFKPGKNS